VRRYALLAVLLAAAALATHAGTPPNLGNAIAAQQALAAEQPADPAVHNDLGNLLLLAGRDEEAEAAYDRALELDAELMSARFNLALLLARRGREATALRHLRKVVDAEPAHSWAWFEMGAIHERRGKRDAAVEHYARAYALNPDLSFAEHNPQVIDSRLLTESLIAAFERWPTSPRPPQDYEDPLRIAGLLDSGADQVAATDGQPSDPLAPPADEPDTATEAAAAARERFEDAMEADEGSAEGGSGQVVGGGRGTPTGGIRDLQGTTLRTYDPTIDAGIEEEPATDVGREAPAQPTRDSFRVQPGGIGPGTDTARPAPPPGDVGGGVVIAPPSSTGRLELRVVPGQRLARAAPPRRAGG
jgi:tetratricopeptide (TPR) repeat protein